MLESSDAVPVSSGPKIAVVLYNGLPENVTGFPVLVVNGIHYRAMKKVVLAGVDKDKAYGAAAALAQEHQAPAYRILEDTDAE